MVQTADCFGAITGEAIHNVTLCLMLLMPVEMSSMLRLYRNDSI